MIDSDLRVVDGELADGTTVYAHYTQAPRATQLLLLAVYRSRATAAHYGAMEGDFDPDRNAYQDYLTLITSRADPCLVLRFLIEPELFLPPVATPSAHE